jgi:hypothetical protein
MITFINELENLIEERNIALGSGFIEPIRPMGPSPMSQYPWQVRVKDKGEISFRHHLLYKKKVRGQDSSPLQDLFLTLMVIVV